MEVISKNEHSAGTKIIKCTQLYFTNEARIAQSE